MNAAIPSYGQPLLIPGMEQPSDPLLRLMLSHVGGWVDPEAAVLLAELMLVVFRSRNGQPQAFVRALTRFRSAAARHGVPAADLPRLERAAIRPNCSD